MKKHLAVVLAARLIALTVGCETNKTLVAEGAGIGGALARSQEALLETRPEVP